MKIRIPRLCALLSALCCAFIIASDAQAQTAFGVTSDNTLIRFNVAAPNSVTTIGAVGVPAGETIVGIDLRPATNQLFALTQDASNVGRLYTINAAATPAATVGAALFYTLTTPLSGTQFGVDFNPIPDALRIVSNTGQNLRVAGFPTGSLVTNTDTPLTRAGGDTTPLSIFAAAYANSDNNMNTGTTLYVLDDQTDSLAVQGSDPSNGTAGNPGNPNSGIITTRGSLNLGNVTSVGGFDITSDGQGGNIAYAAINQSDSTTTQIFLIDLASGAVSSNQSINFPVGTILRSFAIAQVAIENRTFFAVTDTNELLRLAVTPSGNTFTTTSIGFLTGFQTPSETVVGIDFRPSSQATSNSRRQLYAVTRNTNDNTARIYIINLSNSTLSFVVQLVGNSTGAPIILSGTGFGVDFNPVPDLLRIVSDVGQNLRVSLEAKTVGTTNFVAGGTITDTPLTNASGTGTPRVTASAYTNSDSSTATGTALYGIDNDSSSLVLQGTNPSNGTAGNAGNPNSGVLTPVGPLGFSFNEINGFDIGSFTNSITGFAALSAAEFPFALFQINLTDGSTRQIFNAVAAFIVQGDVTPQGLPPQPQQIVGFAVGDLSPTAADGTISGRVTNKNGAPLPGVTVTLRDNTSGSGLRYTTTNAQGRYTFTGVETNNLYTIIVARRSFGFTPDNRTFGFEGDTDEVDFVAIPRGRTFDRRQR